MRLHLPLVILLACLLIFSFVACDRDGDTVSVGGGGVVMNPGSATTTTTTNPTSGSDIQPSRPQGGGGVDLPFLPA